LELDTSASLELDTAGSLELHRWLKVPISDYDMASLKWWAEGNRRNQFPYLSRLAAHHFSIPASSASAERVFSQCGLTFGMLRQSMHEQTVEDLMVINYQHMDGHVYPTAAERKVWEEDEEDELQGERFSLSTPPQLGHGRCRRGNKLPHARHIYKTKQNDCRYVLS
jgi:hypothetical protein